jgi:hypothetical protein
MTSTGALLSKESVICYDDLEYLVNRDFVRFVMDFCYMGVISRWIKQLQWIANQLVL